MARRVLRDRLKLSLKSATIADELLGWLRPITGSIFYVDSGSGDDDDTGLSPTSALATIDAAINKCTANSGDVIYVMPGHAETIAAASGITCDVAGVSIIGLGRGTDRPTLTFSGSTAATVVMSAANVTWENFHFINTEDGLVVGFPVTAAWCGFRDCTFEDDGTDNTVHWITLSADADHFELIDCVNLGTDTAGNTGFVTMAAATGVKIRRLVSNGDFSAANIDMSAAAVDVLIEDCALENANAVDVCIEGFAAATGWIRFNTLRIATDAQVTAINTVGALSLFENYQVNDDGETGILVGTPSA